MTRGFLVKRLARPEFDLIDARCKQLPARIESCGTFVERTRRLRPPGVHVAAACSSMALAMSLAIATAISLRPITG